MIPRALIPKIPLRSLPFPLIFHPLSTAPPSAPGDAGRPPPPPPPPEEAPPPSRVDAYRQLENLDLATAAKILFSDPPKKKKFGLDFHLVQLFFACMPSLAVYLVAQYARYEIRRMEAEAELKKKQAEEEENAKEAELASSGEGSDSELLKVKVRLDALEEAVKEIVDEKKMTSSSSISKDQEGGKKEQVAAVDKISDPEDQSKAAEGTSETSKEMAVTPLHQAMLLWRTLRQKIERLITQKHHPESQRNEVVDVGL